MVVKTVFVLCACVALALGAAIESRAKRQMPQMASDIASGMANNIPGASEIQNGVSAMQGFGDMASSAMNNISNGFQGIGERLQNAFNQTYQEERNSVSDGFNSVKDQLHQNIETGGNLTKTAFDLGTVFPKFGKNLIIGN